MADFSKVLFEKYIRLKNRNMELVLKNGRHIKGVIVGYFKGDEENKEPYIRRWHIVDEDDSATMGFDPFGKLIGELVDHADIAEVYIQEDGSFIKFF